MDLKRPQEYALHNALNKEGIKNIPQYDDGYKKVDIGILWVKIYMLRYDWKCIIRYNI